jgi:hypothetical protein
MVPLVCSILNAGTAVSEALQFWEAKQKAKPKQNWSKEALVNSDDQAGWVLEIIDTVIMPPDGTNAKAYALYIIECRQKGMWGVNDGKWQVYRRYSDFIALHTDLKRESTVAKRIKGAPKKSLSSGISKEFIAKRRTKLQNYLNAIESVGEIAVNPITMKFLGAKVHHAGL